MNWKGLPCRHGSRVSLTVIATSAVPCQKPATDDFFVKIPYKERDGRKASRSAPGTPPPDRHRRATAGLRHHLFYYSGDLEPLEAVAAFAALSLPTRRSPVRLRMAAGPTGLPARDIARLPPRDRWHNRDTP